jgi:hypothetical protein
MFWASFLTAITMEIGAVDLAFLVVAMSIFFQ